MVGIVLRKELCCSLLQDLTANHIQDKSTEFHPQTKRRVALSSCILQTRLTSQTQPTVGSTGEQTSAALVSEIYVLVWWPCEVPIDRAQGLGFPFLIRKVFQVPGQFLVLRVTPVLLYLDNPGCPFSGLPPKEFPT